MHDLDTASPDFGRIALVNWIDSGMQHAAENGWFALEEISAGLHRLSIPVSTVGFYLGATPEVIAIAQTHDAGTDKYLNVQIILKSAITKQGWLSE